MQANALLTAGNSAAFGAPCHARQCGLLPPPAKSTIALPVRHSPRNCTWGVGLVLKQTGCQPPPRHAQKKEDKPTQAPFVQCTSSRMPTTGTGTAL